MVYGLRCVLDFELFLSLCAEKSFAFAAFWTLNKFWVFALAVWTCELFQIYSESQGQGRWTLDFILSLAPRPCIDQYFESFCPVQSRQAFRGLATWIEYILSLKVFRHCRLIQYNLSVIPRAWDTAFHSESRFGGFNTLRLNCFYRNDHITALTRPD